MLLLEMGHTLTLITTITNKKYLILTFPPNLDTKINLFLNKFLQSSQEYVNI